MVDTRPSSADDSGNGGGDVGKGQPSLSPTSSPTNSTKDKGGAEKGVPWARLLSQNSKSPHLSISASQFLVGRREDCDLYVKDSLVSQGSIVCKLRRVEQEGLCMLEVTGGSCQVIVNTRRFYEGRYPLIGGEEVVFGSSGMHAYIFQHPLDVNQNNCNRPPSDYQTPNDVLKQGILSPDAIQDTLENFPYYLSENTKNPLLSVATVHLEKKFHPSLSAINSTNQRILLSGPSGSEIYQDKLIKALAKKFDASLLIVDSLLLAGAPSKVPKTLKDVNMSRPGDRVKYVGRYQRYLHPRQKRYQRGPSKGDQGRVLLAFENKIYPKVGVRFDKTITDGNDLGGLCEEDHGFFCPVNELRPEVERFTTDELIEVISEESKASPLIVLVKDVEKAFTGSTELHISRE